MDQHKRLKRTYRACEPCRRKKVKCSGERPSCSYCARLGQYCEYRYTDVDPSEILQDGILGGRIEAIEEKLDEILAINRANIAGRSYDGSSTSTHLAAQPAFAETQPESSSQSDTDPSRINPSEPDLTAAFELYQIWCHNQPLYHFRQDGFLQSIQSRDREVCLAIKILASRFPPGTLTAEKRKELDGDVQTCRRLVMERVSSSNIKLSTLQTLSLLSLISFGDGNVMQAGLDLTMAHYFASDLPTGSSLGDALECSLCIQSIALLRHIQERVAESERAGHAGVLSRKATSASSSHNWSSRFPLLGEPGRELDPGLRILPYVAQAAEVWQMARNYSASPVGPDEIPPWDPQSDYSLIMLRLLEMDSEFPLKYRFVRNKFSELSPEALLRQRDYWGPWFFIQIIHSTIPALTFMHQSFDQIARHTPWVICFIDMMEKQNFQLSDPVIAHCVAIVATIHLQHSFVMDDDLREKAQRGYEKCTRFLDRMGAMWPIASSMAQNLTNLHNSVTTVPSANAHDQQNSGMGGSWSIDAQLLWDILIYEKAGRPNASADRSMFSDAIALDPQQHRDRDQDMAEFAMVGSAGISGHKTVAKEVSAYAPREEERFGRVGGASAASSSLLMGEDLRLNYHQYAEVIQDPNQMMYDQNCSLQPEDYGKAFYDWFNLDIS